MLSRKAKHIKTTHGLTIVEVLIASSLLVVIGSLMISFIMQGSSLWEIITGQSDLRSSLRNAMNSMEQELRKTTRTSTETPSPNLIIPSKPNNTSVDFYLPGDSDNNGLIIDAMGATEWDKSNKIQYQYVPGLKLLRRLEKGNFRTIARNVALIEFEDTSINSALYNAELKIILTLEKNTRQQRTISASITSVIKMRNQ